MTAKDFLRWKAYDQLEPFGDKRDDYRAASIRQMVFNMAVPVKDRKPLNDFLLKFEDGKGEAQKSSVQTWQEKKSIAYAIALAYGTPKQKSASVDSEARARAMAEAVLDAYKARS